MTLTIDGAKAYLTFYRPEYGVFFIVPSVLLLSGEPFFHPSNALLTVLILVTKITRVS